MRASAGSLQLPSPPMVDRMDGGHLVVCPARSVWDIGELSAAELAKFSALTAASASAMLATLDQLADGCINYWDAGNWKLHDSADPLGRKAGPTHRDVHVHLFGRSPSARGVAWRWGEAPKFPDFSDRERWSAGNTGLTANECAAVVAASIGLLTAKYGWKGGEIDEVERCRECRYPTPLFEGQPVCEECRHL